MSLLVGVARLGEAEHAEGQGHRAGAQSGWAKKGTFGRTTTGQEAWYIKGGVGSEIRALLEKTWSATKNCRVGEKASCKTAGMTRREGRSRAAMPCFAVHAAPALPCAIFLLANSVIGKRAFCYWS